VMGFLMAAKQVLEQRAAKKAQEIQQTALMQQT